jgi:predicted small integral membrane protein
LRDSAIVHKQIHRRWLGLPQRGAAWAALIAVCVFVLGVFNRLAD